MKTVYCFRIRMGDNSSWSAPSYFMKRKERDKEAALNRILAGIRTHSYEEKLPREEAEALCLCGDWSPGADL